MGKKHSSFDQQLASFLEGAQDRDFIVFTDPDDPDQFVQFALYRGSIVGEVGSRQWGKDTEPMWPLSRESERRLREFGFTDGGPQANYFRDLLPRSPAALGVLTKALFARAYGGHRWPFPDVTTTVELSEMAVLHCRSYKVVGRPEGHKCGCPRPHSQEPPLNAAPDLAARAWRALASNFMNYVLHCEDRWAFRSAVESVGAVADLQPWAHSWILKAEEGPLMTLE